MGDTKEKSHHSFTQEVSDLLMVSSTQPMKTAVKFKIPDDA